ncbi:hypothetical protein C8R46DRAFT_1226596 [Mycena filopes]|nr:hypothetical protein C8R46DRAFT_1226596 [Mycena filopes]
MSNTPARDFEVLRSGSYWKDFHEARHARLARAAAPPQHNLHAPTFHALSHPDMVYTFVPGRNQPIVTLAGAPRPKPTTRRTEGGVVRQRNAYTAPSGTNTHLASHARDDKETLRRLRQSQTQRLVEMARTKTARGKEQLAVAHKPRAGGDSSVPEGAKMTTHSALLMQDARVRPRSPGANGHRPMAGARVNLCICQYIIITSDLARLAFDHHAQIPPTSATRTSPNAAASSFQCLARIRRHAQQRLCPT